MLIITHGVYMKFDEFVNSDDALFHYTKTNVFFENILSEMKLRLSPLGFMNDPMEYKEPLFTYSEIGDALMNQQLENDAKKALTSLKLEECKIACFCVNRKNQTKGYLRSRMWSQYGDNHTGVCLVFSKETIQNQIDDNYKFKNVEYITEPFPLNDYNIELGMVNYNGIDMYFNHFFEQQYKNIFFKKIDDYRDESEYRLLRRVKDTSIVYDYIDINSSLKGIIIGDRCHHVYNHIFDYVNTNKHLELLRCQFDQLTGVLNLEPYNSEGN